MASLFAFGVTGAPIFLVIAAATVLAHCCSVPSNHPTSIENIFGPDRPASKRQTMTDLITNGYYIAVLLPRRDAILNHSKVMKTVHLCVTDDTLWVLAETHLGDGMLWPTIALLNNLSNPDMLLPGERLLIPTRKTARKILERAVEVGALKE